jgi:soluble cytochrome b562
MACTNSPKREATALADAVDRFRNANGAAVAAQAAAVTAVACTDARVCEARHACVDAVDPTARALALKDEVTLKLADIESAKLSPEAPEAQELPGKLDEASRLLQEGHTKMQACETKLTDLRVTYAF